MFRLNIFPADDGDCLLLDYGRLEPNRHILVDGGRRGAYAKLRPELVRLAARGERIDLLVLTHIDADHIEGLLELIKDPDPPIEIDQVWYNGYRHLSVLEAFGPKQGDEFSELISNKPWGWNSSFAGGPVVADLTKPTVVELPEGMRLTLLSPTREALHQLHVDWSKWRYAQASVPSPTDLGVPNGLEAFGRARIGLPLKVEELATAKTEIDTGLPNGSSIAMVAEFEGKRTILSGDAHPDVLIRSLRLLGEEDRYKCDLFKVSHHGSRANTTAALIGVLDCYRFAISTSGARHGHPDPEAIARLIKYAPAGLKTLYFNYAFERTLAWADEGLMRDYAFRCEFLGGGDDPLRIDI